MIKEPLFIEPRTYRNYDDYRQEVARARGWNEAMEFIFAQELEATRAANRRSQMHLISCREHLETVKGGEE